MTSHLSPALPITDARYVSVKTIAGFEDSVNCLQFNENAELLAIGCDDGVFKVLEIEDDATVLKFRIANVAVTSLLWHPEEINTIFVGYSDGGIVQCTIDPTDRQALPNVTPVPAGLPDTVEALDYSPHTSTLAAIIGSSVVCLTLSENGLWISRIMPSPPSDNILPYAEGNLPRSLHFAQQGRILIVAYLYHGIFQQVSSAHGTALDTSPDQIRSASRIKWATLALASAILLFLLSSYYLRPCDSQLVVPPNDAVAHFAALVYTPEGIISRSLDRLFSNRLRVVELAGLQHHARLFERMNANNMSGDEWDEESFPKIYRVVESRWQSNQLKTFLRALDGIYRNNWENSGGHRLPGLPPRARGVNEGGPVEHGYPPIGLWRNCYDLVWLQGLQPAERDALSVIDEDYDFSLPVNGMEGVGDSAFA
ncbi:hypothetical protein VTO73DRAFT_11483 [Trametes versicolor]